MLQGKKAMNVVRGMLQGKTAGQGCYKVRQQARMLQGKTAGWDVTR